MFLFKWCYNTLLSNFWSIICQMVAYERLETIEKFQLFSSESGRGRFTKGGRLQEDSNSVIWLENLLVV